MRQLRQNGDHSDETAPAPRGGDGHSRPLVRAACLGCGGDIADVLVRLGSIWCHDCRGGGKSRVGGLPPTADVRPPDAPRAVGFARGAAALRAQFRLWRGRIAVEPEA
jgi:hypothetical protein